MNLYPVILRPQKQKYLQRNERYDEEKLLLRLAEGDEDAFAEIYNEFVTPLTGYAASRLSSLEEARDIIHDLFTYLWQERANLTIVHSLKAFLFAALRYRIIDHIRHNIVREKHIEQELLTQNTQSPSAEQSLEAKNLNEAIRKAADSLSPRLREIYKLSRSQHLTTAEIAEHLQISQQTVKNQLTTALSFIRASLKKLHGFIWFL